MWSWKRLAAIALGAGMMVAGSLVPGAQALMPLGGILAGHAINGSAGGKVYEKRSLKQ